MRGCITTWDLADFQRKFTPSPVRLRISWLSYASSHLLSAVMTLCACTPPLDQVLQLWDFLLAFGVHLNVLCVIAQLLLMRDDLMASTRQVTRANSLYFQNWLIFPSPMKLLRTFPSLDAPAVIAVTVTLVRDVPKDLYDELVRHPYEIWWWNTFHVCSIMITLH